MVISVSFLRTDEILDEIVLILARNLDYHQTQIFESTRYGMKVRYSAARGYKGKKVENALISGFLGFDSSPSASPHSVNLLRSQTFHRIHSRRGNSLVEYCQYPYGQWKRAGSHKKKPV